MESMKQELEEKIRKLEEDKQNMDISAGKIIDLFVYNSVGLTKIHIVKDIKSYPAMPRLITKLKY